MICEACGRRAEACRCGGSLHMEIDPLEDGFHIWDPEHEAYENYDPEEGSSE